MKHDSLFFFIDTLGVPMIPFLDATTEKFNCFNLVSKKACDHYYLSIDFINLRMCGKYTVNRNYNYCFFSSASWLKLEKGKDSKPECPLLAVHSNRMKKDKKVASKNAYKYRKSLDVLFPRKVQK